MFCDEVCDEVCDVTKLRTFIYDLWVRDEYWHPFWHLVRFQRHSTRMQEKFRLKRSGSRHSQPDAGFTVLAIELPLAHLAIRQTE